MPTVIALKQVIIKLSLLCGWH